MIKYVSLDLGACSCPSYTKVKSSIEIISIFSYTSSVASAVCPPSSVVTVIVTIPCPTPVTRPFSSTVAIDVSSDDQLTFLLLAFLGSTVAVSWIVFGVKRYSSFGLTLTLLTGTVGVSDCCIVNSADTSVPSSQGVITSSVNIRSFMVI